MPTKTRSNDGASRNQKSLRKTRRTSLFFKPLIECLEDRVVPTGVVNLTSSNGFLFDAEAGDIGAGQLIEGTNRAFDGLNRLEVAGQVFSPPPTQAPSATTLLDRSIVTGFSIVGTHTLFNETVSMGSTSGLVRISGSFELANNNTVPALVQTRILVNGATVHTQNFELAPRVGSGPTVTPINIEDYRGLAAGFSNVQILLVRNSSAIAEVESSATSHLRVDRFNPFSDGSSPASVLRERALATQFLISGTNTLFNESVSLGSTAGLVRVSSQFSLSNSNTVPALVQARILVDGSAVHTQNFELAPRAGSGPNVTTISLEDYVSVGAGAHSVTLQLIRQSSATAFVEGDATDYLRIVKYNPTPAGPNVATLIGARDISTQPTISGTVTLFNETVSMGSTAGLVRISSGLSLSNNNTVPAFVRARILVDGSTVHVQNFELAPRVTSFPTVTPINVEDYVSLGSGSHNIRILLEQAGGGIAFVEGSATSTFRAVKFSDINVGQTVFATSDGDTIVETTDKWFGTDDVDGAGFPSLIHFVHGPAGLEPTSISVNGNEVEWTYNVTIAAGETTRLGLFTIQAADRASAITQANSLVSVSGFGGEAAVFLSQAEVDSIANFQFNLPPVADAGPDQNVSEGTLVSLDGSFTDPNPADTHTFLWTVSASNGQSIADGTSEDFSFTANDNGVYTLIYTVTDDAGASDSDTVVVTVNNVAPVANAGPDQTVDEGDLVTLNGSFTDAGSVDGHKQEWSVVASNGQVISPLTIDNLAGDSNGAGGSSFSFTPADNGTYTVTYTVTDDDGGVHSDTATVTVNNVAPTLVLDPVVAIDEDGVATLTGTITDPGTLDTITLDIDWNDPLSPDNTETYTFNASATGSQTFTLTHKYLDDNPTATSSDTYTISATVTDDDTETGNDSQTVTVNNVAPTLVLDPVATINEDGVATLTGTITDPGTLDTFSLDINWGDPLSPDNTETYTFGASATGSQTFILTHQYLDDNPTGTPSDQYEISVTVSDDDGESDTALGTPTTIGNDTQGTGRQIFHFEPTGQTFTAVSSTLTLFEFFVADANAHIDPTDYDLDIDLYSGIGAGGALLGTRTFSGLSDGFSGYISVDFSSIALTPGATYTSIIRNDNARWFLNFGSNTYAGGTAIVTGSPIPSEDARFRATFAGDGVQVTVNNVAPTLVLESVSAIDENGVATLTGTITDPGTLDTFTLDINWGDPLSPDNVETYTFSASATGSQTFTLTHKYLDDNPTATALDSYTISATLTDDDTGTGSDTQTVTVNNVAPTIVLDPVVAIDEDGVATLTGTITDPGTLDTFTMSVNWGDPLSPDNAETYTFSASATGSQTFTLTHKYLDDNPTATSSETYTISATVTDDDTGIGSDTQTVTVNNVAPTLVLDPVVAIDENGVATLTGTITDPGTLDTFTLDIDWGDPLSPDNVEQYTFSASATGSQTFTLTHKYLDDNPTATSSDTYTISATVTDDDTGTGSDTETVTVNNVAPTLVLNPVVAIDEDGVATLTGTITDPGTLDTFTLAVNWGDPLSPDNTETYTFSASATGSQTFTLTHKYLDDNPTATSSDTYTISATVTDDDTESSSDTQTVTVNNVAPQLQNVTVTSPISENGIATLSGDIVDPGTLDTFTLTVDWGDGSLLQTFTYGTGTTTFSETHQYLDDNPSGTPSDEYIVSATLTDDDGGSDSIGGGSAIPNILLIDSDDTTTTQAFNSLGISYTLTTAAGFSGVNLNDYNILFVGWNVGSAKVNALNARSTDIAAWNNAGNGIVALSPYSPGEFDWAPLSNTIVPNHANDIVIVDAGHPVNAGLTDALLSGWGNSRHSYFTSWDSSADVLTANSGGNPVTIAAENGSGKIVLSGQDPDFHYTFGSEPGAAKFINNLIDWVTPSISGIPVTVNNVAPTLVLNPVVAIDEDGVATLTGTITDPGTLDTFTMSVNWGDPLSPNNVEQYSFSASATGSQTFTLTHKYLDDNPTATSSDTYTISATVTDDDTGTGSDTETVTVNNVAPILVLDSVVAIDEDGVATLTGTITDPGTLDTFTLDIDWGDPLSPDNVEQYTFSASATGSQTFTLTHKYLDDNPTVTASDTYTISATVTDDDTESSSDTQTVTVNNVAPALVLDPVVAINEDGVATLTGTITDPGTLDTFTLAVNWGDPLSPDNTETYTFSASATGSQTFSLTHKYLDDNPTATSSDTYTISATVTDDDTGSGGDTQTVTVNNVGPTLVLDSVVAIAEDGVATLTGTITDPGTLDTFTLAVNWGDPLSPDNTETYTFSASATGSQTFTLTHKYLDDNPTATASDPYTISATVTDDDTGTGSDTETVTVNNVAPTLVLDPVVAISEDGVATLIGAITDPGTLDTFTLDIDWGDPLSPDNVETYSFGASATGSQTFTLTHQYLDDNPTATALDSYTISATVTDDDTGTGSDTQTVTVNNVAPTLTLNSVSAIDENGVATLTGAITDPGTLDTFTLAVNWGDPLSPDNTETYSFSASATGSQTFTLTHKYLDDNPTATASDTYTISATVTDDDTGSGGDIQTVTVNNVAPIASASADVIVNEGDSVTLSGSFTDVGGNDGHKQEWTVVAGNGQVVSPLVIDNLAADSNGAGDSDFTFTVEDNGTYTVTYIVTDDDGGVHSDTVVVTVLNVAPAVSVSPANQIVQYSDSISTITFTATDVPADTMNAVISYSMDGGTTFTSGLPDAASIAGGLALAGAGDQVTTGTWTVAGIADLAPGSYVIRLTVSDEDGGISTKDATIVVTKENADATYDGPLFVSTDPKDPDNGVIPLRAVIRDITAFDPMNDPEAGHITRATVSFINRDTNTVIASGVQVNLLGSDPKIGVATFDWDVSLNKNDTAVTFDIGIEVDGYYTGVADDVLITVARPDGDFITGGGYIVSESSAGAYAAGNGLKTNFGFNVKFNKKLTNLQGHFNAIVRRANGQILKIKSNATDSLVVDPTIGVDGHATFVSKANLTDVTDPNNPIGLGGNLQLIVNTTDNGEPGDDDTISFALWDGSTLLFSSNFDGTKTIEQTIGGGNVQVHTDVQPLQAARGSAASSLTSVEVVSDQSLQAIVAEAIDRWNSTGLSASERTELSQVNFQIGDLSGAYLGLASDAMNTIWIDSDAAGWGWFIDATPWDDGEFLTSGNQGEQGRMDLLTTVMHELGHILGYDDLDPELYRGDLMSATLTTGTRRLPVMGEIGETFVTPVDPFELQLADSLGTLGATSTFSNRTTQGDLVPDSSDQASWQNTAYNWWLYASLAGDVDSLLDDNEY